MEFITRLGLDGCSDCPWTKKAMPDGRSKRGACLLSEMAPLQIVAIVTENEVEKPLVIWENSLMHSSYAARPLRYKIIGILLPKLFRPSARKKCSNGRKKKD